MTDYFVHDHLSGRFTVSAAQEEAAVDASMRVCDLFTTTEVSKPAQARALREPGWTAIFGNKGPRDDCGISIRNERFRLIEGGTATLSHLTYQTESFGVADTHEGAYAVIEDKRSVFKHAVGVVVVAHLPHGMQDDIRLNRPGSDVAKAYRDIVRGARQLATDLRREHKANWTMIVADWNLNVKNAWVPLYLKSQFPTYHLNWQRPYPKRGTFGNMIFDFALLRGIDNRRNPTILSRSPGFDHLGWRQLLG